MHSTESNNKSEVSGIYGSFSLGESEFALSASSIQEVVNEPEAYSVIPLSPAYLLGIFNLRGVIVPVVDLRRIFDLPIREMDGHEQRKVAIVEHGHLCLGLLFDATAEVFSDEDVETCWFESRGSSERDQVVKGVFKLDEGRRIVQILDAQGMLNLEKLPRTGSPDSVIKAKRKRGLRKQCISFTVGNSHCALDIASIREIVDIKKIENTDLSSKICPGLIDIRGSTVPVINFSAVLGCGDSPVDAVIQADSSRVIVMKVVDGLFGLLVDSIESIITYFDEDLMPFPVLGEQASTLFLGCISSTDDSSHTIVLKHDEILTNQEIEGITKGCDSLFNDSVETSRLQKKGALNSSTLITFSLGSRYGLDIAEVREVIDLPDNMIKTPNMSGHMRGMANLRGELVAVIDSRELYELDECQSLSNAKVLVFERDGVKQGLMVDSVDSIMPFSQDDLADIPRIMFEGSGNLIGEDVKKALIVGDESNADTICLFDLSSVSARASL